MCDILKPLEQDAAVETQSSTPELVSAGVDATASVAAIMETHPYDASSRLGADDIGEQS